MLDTIKLIPSPDVLPAPQIIFHVLNVAMFMLHIILVNIVLGGSLYLLYRHFRGAGDIPGGINQDSNSLRHKLPTVMAFAINLGIPALLFLQVVWGQFFYTSSVLMAVSWILIIPVLLVVYYGLYRYAYVGDDNRFSGTIVMSICLGLFAISFIFVNNMTLMVQPESWLRYFRFRGGTLLNLADKTIFPRWLHVICASVAVSGLIMALLARLRSEKDGAGQGEMEIRKGLKIYARATFIEALIGIWFLAVLPDGFVKSFMGGNTAYTVILGCGLVFSVLSAVTALAGKFAATSVLFMLTIAAMVITRDNLRSLYMGPYFSPASIPVAPQYGLLVLFAVVLVAGIAAIVWMMRFGMSEKDGGAL